MASPLVQPTTKLPSRSLKMSGSSEGNFVWLFILTSVLALNLVLTAFIFLRGPIEVPQVMTGLEKEELTSRVHGLTTELTKAKAENSKIRGQISVLQSNVDSLTSAVSRIPPPNVPPHGPPPATTNTELGSPKP